jgi:hypothetical protein
MRMRARKIPRVSQALTRLLVEKGIFTKGQFLEMVRVVAKETKGMEFKNGEEL